MDRSAVVNRVFEMPAVKPPRLPRICNVGRRAMRQAAATDLMGRRSIARLSCDGLHRPEQQRLVIIKWSRETISHIAGV
jgi:hypothetical protein